MSEFTVIEPQAMIRLALIINLQQMTDEKWQEVVGRIKDNPNLTLISEGKYDLPSEEGPGSVEILEFDGPLGQIRLERDTRPVVIDKKTKGSKRIGSYTEVEYVYSDTEKSHKLSVYKLNPASDQWEELAMDRGQMMF